MIRRTSNTQIDEGAHRRGIIVPAARREGCHRENLDMMEQRIGAFIERLEPLVEVEVAVEAEYGAVTVITWAEESAESAVDLKDGRRKGGRGDITNVGLDGEGVLGNDVLKLLWERLDTIGDGEHLGGWSDVLDDALSVGHDSSCGLVCEGVGRSKTTLIGVQPRRMCE